MVICFCELLQSQNNFLSVWPEVVIHAIYQMFQVLPFWIHSRTVLPAEARQAMGLYLQRNVSEIHICPFQKKALEASVGCAPFSCLHALEGEGPLGLGPQGETGGRDAS